MEDWNLFVIVILCVILGYAEVFAEFENRGDWHSKKININDYAHSIHDIDEGVHFGYIPVFENEWKKVLDRSDHPVPSAFNFWFRCIDHEVRAYFHVEDLRAFTHGKEADMPLEPHVKEKIKILVDDKPIEFQSWFGGAQFYFQLPQNISRDYMSRIQIKGFGHYTRFPSWKCSPPIPQTPTTKYVMHIHLREFIKPLALNADIVEGVLNHMNYHRCLLGVDRHEIVIQKEQIPFYLENRRVAQAVRKGWLHLLIRNPSVPAPIENNHQGSDCYWQAYTENLGLLRHWKENTKMYFMDSDEYIVLPNEDKYPKEYLFDQVNQHHAVGIERFMSFCIDCPRDQAEIKLLNFNKNRYTVTDKLRDPKLLVNPNEVGCYIVHWAGCGKQTKVLPVDKVYLLHFENLYIPRWKKTVEELKKDKLFTNTKGTLKCDPASVHFHGKLHHGRNTNGTRPIHDV